MAEQGNVFIHVCLHKLPLLFLVVRFAVSHSPAPVHQKDDPNPCGVHATPHSIQTLFTAAVRPHYRHTEQDEGNVCEQG